jgi:hypothetical protein
VLFLSDSDKAQTSMFSVELMDDLKPANVAGYWTTRQKLGGGTFAG